MNPPDKEKYQLERTISLNKVRSPQLNGAICGRRSGVCCCPCSKGERDDSDSDQGEVMNESYLEADEGVIDTPPMVEEKEFVKDNSHKIVLINTQWTKFVYNKDGFNIYNGEVTDDQKLSQSIKGLQLEASEGVMTPTYMDYQYEMDTSMTSDAYSWRSHSPGVLVEGIGRWVDEVQVPESLVFSPLTLTPVWQMPTIAGLTLLADQGELTAVYPDLMEEDFVFES